MATIYGKREGDVGRAAKRTVAVTVILYVAACCLPATDIGSLGGGALGDGPIDRTPSTGLEHLLLGHLDFFRSLPPWSANFVLFAGVVQSQRGRLGSAALLGALSVALGLTTLVSYKHNTKYVGYYLWQGSQAVFALGSLGLWLRVRPNETI